ncbi:ATP-binding cassette domain-containing protein [Aeromicrobium sp. SMF47]|uniref:ATP-binding cassette domain-containing protein n=1 Tax=Aeromicrobium yanjiei TaxID=2662028 RepID=A0A5Q2ME16_9ACTN|nr:MULTISPECIES: ABC transporter ATP-binding protein [Aeromicrobium]MRJ77563.1 ATP-binding cassette domain-containing protein [Aeromicrobium yanjiei]MRK01931.1 ATP-binding cassette domain-containing protein [Aeromicrobium sp. S22]QGG41334.1 ATP-binding cassette domain-containing protein [Aeromicrobium yanjiei]
MPAAFELTHVSVERSGKALLDDVSWTVGEGERWVVLGPNGAGKTTLLQVIGAMLHPTKGTVEILGDTLGQVAVAELRTRIGHTSTKVADRIPPAESVRDAVLSAAHAVTGRWHEEYDEEDLARAEQILGEWGVSALAGRTFGTLSEGERKRVLIARALMTDPELLLLDEPGAGLDLGAREDLLASLEMLSRADDSPVLVMVSHHVEEIPVGFTHVLLMRDGKVVAQGPLETTLTADNLGVTFGQRIALDRAGGRYAARRAAYGRRADRSHQTGDTA